VLPSRGDDQWVTTIHWKLSAAAGTLRANVTVNSRPGTTIMADRPIDLRSDTVTQPTLGMRKAMAEAEVGDDVLGADPTAVRLEEHIAQVLGKEAALFMPSGTMANQVAVRLHCQPGDELLCERDCHIFNYEQGAFAQLSGVAAQTVEGLQGVMRREQLELLIRPENDHLVRTRLVCLENTHNRGGGKILPLDEVTRICEWAHAAGLKTHLDGARLFNAVVASGIEAVRWASLFDTVSVCFSKGLGAPVGSALVGDRGLIRQARRYRKLFGGGMRQCGIIAAGALYALEHHVDRLVEDHEKARMLADFIRHCSGLTLTYNDVETNIVFFDVDPRLGSARQFVAELADQGVLMLAETQQRVRALTHLDVSVDEVQQAGQLVQHVASRAAALLV
jgi:threonine aldolase